jgi:hypothetical protein
MPSNYLLPGLALLAALLGGLWLLWTWGFCRFYVPPGHMAVITAKEGAELPPEQILARRGQKGVWEETLGEGRHFLNPYLYEHRIVPNVRIPPGKVGVVTAKVGATLPPGEFLAEPGQKGIWRHVLGPGTYRLNPIGYEVTLADAVSLPVGYVGVLTSLSGAKTPEGEFAGPRQKGVMKDVLQPGFYYLNPKAYKIDVLEIGLNQVTFSGREGGKVLTKSQMATSNVALDALTSNVLNRQMAQRQDYLEQQMAQQPEAAPSPAAWSPRREAERGRRPQAAAKPAAAAQAAPGGPAQAVAGFEIAQFVEFPSRDGFEILLDMTVEFELEPARIARIFRQYGDLPAVVDKIIMPQILSVSRLKGSSYKAQDFIVGEGREKFQADLKETLADVLAEKQILIHNSLIRNVEVPAEILTPIRLASVAMEQNLTNLARQETARKKAELNTAETLVEQRRQEVMQETEKLAAEIAAARDTQVAAIRAQADLEVARLNQEKAQVEAGITRCLGDAKARVTTLVEGERARGTQLQADVLRDGQALVWLSLAEAINPKVQINILHAGSGTLWTDLKGATLGDLGGARLLQPPPPVQP